MVDLSKAYEIAEQVRKNREEEERVRAENEAKERGERERKFVQQVESWGVQIDNALIFFDADGQPTCTIAPHIVLYALKQNRAYLLEVTYPEGTCDADGSTHKCRTLYHTGYDQDAANFIEAFEALQKLLESAQDPVAWGFDTFDDEALRWFNAKPRKASETFPRFTVATAYSAETLQRALNSVSGCYNLQSIVVTDSPTLDGLWYTAVLELEP